MTLIIIGFIILVVIMSIRLIFNKQLKHTSSLWYNISTIIATICFIIGIIYEVLTNN